MPKFKTPLPYDLLLLESISFPNAAKMPKAIEKSKAFGIFYWLASALLSIPTGQTVSVPCNVLYSRTFAGGVISFHRVKPRIRIPPISCMAVRLSCRIDTDTKTATNGSI